MKRMLLSALIAVIILINGCTQAIQSTEPIDDYCTKNVDFGLSKACISGEDRIKVFVTNDGEILIDQILVRSYGSTGDFEEDILSLGLKPFSLKSDSYQVDKLPIKLVEAIPIVTNEGKTIICTQNVQRYGDIKSSGIETC